MTKLKGLFLFLVFQSLLVLSHDRNQIFTFADSLADNGLVHEAITEYQRYLFLNRDLSDQKKGEIWLRLAVCYRKMNLEADMMNAFNQAYPLIQDSVLINNFYEEIIIFFLSRGKSDLARIFLSKLKAEIPDAKNDAYLCFSFLMEKNWDHFYLHLKRLELNEMRKNNVIEWVKKMKSNKRRFKLLNMVDIFLPGIVLSFYGDVINSGESLLFHFYFLQEIFSDSTLIAKVINSIGVARLYSKTRGRNRQFLKKMLQKKNLELEEKIFKIIFGLK